MEKEFIPYELALALKELGFDEDCFACFDGGGFRMLPVYDPLKNSEIKEHWFCVTPLYQQAFRWFREKKVLYGIVSPSKSVVGMYYWEILDDHLNCIGHSPYYSQEEAELACLKKLIELVKNK